MTEKKFSFGFGNGTMELALPTAQIIHEIEGRPAEALTDVLVVREMLELVVFEYCLEALKYHRSGVEERPVAVEHDCFDCFTHTLSIPFSLKM